MPIPQFFSRAVGRARRGRSGTAAARGPRRAGVGAAHGAAKRVRRGRLGGAARLSHRLLGAVHQLARHPARDRGASSPRALNAAGEPRTSCAFRGGEAGSTRLAEVPREPRRHPLPTSAEDAEGGRRATSGRFDGRECRAAAPGSTSQLLSVRRYERCRTFARLEASWPMTAFFFASLFRRGRKMELDRAQGSRGPGHGLARLARPLRRAARQRNFAGEAAPARAAAAAAGLPRVLLPRLVASRLPKEKSWGDGRCATARARKSRGVGEAARRQLFDADATLRILVDVKGRRDVAGVVVKSKACRCARRPRRGHREVGRRRNIDAEGARPDALKRCAPDARRGCCALRANQGELGSQTLLLASSPRTPTRGERPRTSTSEAPASQEATLEARALPPARAGGGARHYADPQPSSRKRRRRAHARQRARSSLRTSSSG